MTAVAPSVPASSDARWASLAMFLDTEYPRVVSAVRLIAGDPDDATDAVQDALVQLLADPDREWPRNVAAWVTVVASNRARDVHRRAAVGRRVTARLGGEQRAAVVEELLDRVARDADVLVALETLPQRMRQICVLHYLHDQPVVEIAHALGIGTGTVKTQLHRARAALALRLREPV